MFVLLYSIHKTTSKYPSNNIKIPTSLPFLRFELKYLSPYPIYIYKRVLNTNGLHHEKRRNKARIVKKYLIVSVTMLRER